MGTSCLQRWCKAYQGLSPGKSPWTRGRSWSLWWPSPLPHWPGSWWGWTSQPEGVLEPNAGLGAETSGASLSAACDEPQFTTSQFNPELVTLQFKLWLSRITNSFCSAVCKYAYQRFGGETNPEQEEELLRHGPVSPWHRSPQVTQSGPAATNPPFK